MIPALPTFNALDVENINGSDFGSPKLSDDLLTPLNDASDVTSNLGDDNNRLDLATGSNTLANIYGVCGVSSLHILAARVVTLEEEPLRAH